MVGFLLLAFSIYISIELFKIKMANKYTCSGTSIEEWKIDVLHLDLIWCVIKEMK